MHWGQAVDVQTDTFPGQNLSRPRSPSFLRRRNLLPRACRRKKNASRWFTGSKWIVENPSHELKPGMPADVDDQTAVAQDTMSSSPAIVVSSLSKHFGEVRAVDGLSFEVYAGEIFGLVGPDGAGKTTTLRMLAGVMAADSGSVTGCRLRRGARPGRRQIAPQLHVAAVRSLRGS